MIVIPCILENFRSLNDKSLKLTFNTNEPTPEQVLGIASSSGQFGYLAFKTEMFKKNERDAIESLETDYQDAGKTPSQRLRGVLYRCYEKSNEGFDTFSRYYDHQMEKLLTHFKSKLD